MRDAANIADIAPLGAEYIGLIFVPSSARYVGSDFDSASLSSLPSTTKRVGVFKNSPLETITETTRRHGLHVVQLHGGEDHNYLTSLKKELPHTTIFKAVSVSSPGSLAELTRACVHPDVYLLDSGSGGTGTSFNWSWLESYTVDVPFFLAGGIGAHNVDEVVKLSATYPHLIGIDINSRAEREVGIKDKQTLHAIFEGLGR